MKKGFFVLGIVLLLVLPISFGALTFNYTTGYDDDLIFLGDNLTITIFDDAGSLSSGLSGNVSLDDRVLADITPTNFSSGEYIVTFTVDNSFSSIVVNLDGDEVTAIENSSERYVFTASTSLLPMRSISNVITLNISEYNYNHELVLGTCSNVILESYSGSASSFVHTFTTAGDVSLIGNCTYPISGAVENLEFNFSVSEYEPQLTLVDSHPFENLSSTSGFNLGNFDFNLDGKDDIIVVGSFGMLIYSGDGYSVVWNSSEHSLSYAGVDFFISDLNWDGKGDMIVYSSSFVDVLTWNGDWSFTKNDLVDSSNINYAGVFDIDGDFYKDVIVLNGIGNTWNYSFYNGQDLSLADSTTYSETKFLCNYIRSFDYDKDGFEEIVCLDTENDIVRFYDRNSTTTEIDNTSLTSYFTYDLGYTAGIEGIFFTDINSDGDWDLGVLDGDVSKYYFYNLSPDLISLSQDFDPGVVNTNYDYNSLDILNDNANQFLMTYRFWNGDFNEKNLTVFYNETISRSSLIDFRDFSYLNYNDDSDIDIIAMDDSDDYLNILENNISSYVKTNHSYSANILIVDNSTNVKFSFDNITSEWNYNNYFFKVEHSADNTIYRNDVFDSKQNLKYYQVKADDSYEFDFSNRDLYTITFALNPYNMILADPINVTKEAQGYECLTTESVCFISSTSTQTNVDVNASYVEFFTSGTKTTARFIDSTFTNLELVLTNTSDEFTNVTFTNVTLNITESEFSKLFLRSTFINSSIYISNTSVNFNDSVLTNTVITGSNYLLSNSSRISFTSNGNSISLSGIINRTDGVEENFGLTSSLNRFWIYQNDSIVYNYTIIPETNFEYFANQTTLSDFTQDYTITFNPTGLPYWNYSSNSSYQTDFRNYTLLENISNITGVKLSLEGLNMTLETYENLSGLNLSNRVNLTNQGFVFDLPGNWIINYSSALSSPIILKDGSNITLQNESTIFYGSELTSGSYEFTERYNFSVEIPSNVLFNQSFNVSIVYTDKVTLDDFSNTCNIIFDSVSGTFVNMNLTTLGNVAYNVSCTGIDYVEEVGTIYVSNNLFYDWSEEIGLFDVVDQSDNLNPTAYLFSILSNDSFAYLLELNSTSSVYSNDFLNIIFDEVKANLFYYSGNINSEQKEVIN